MGRRKSTSEQPIKPTKQTPAQCEARRVSFIQRAVALHWRRINKAMTTLQRAFRKNKCIPCAKPKYKKSKRATKTKK